MNEQLMQEVLARIDMLAAKLGIAAEYLWDVFMRQAYMVNGWYSLAIGLIVTTVGIVAMFRFAQYARISAEADKIYMSTMGEEERAAARAYKLNATAAVFCGLLSLGAIIGPIAMFDAVAHLINPAYYAFKAIIGG